MASPQSINRPVQELFGQHLGYGFAGFGVSTAIGNYTETAVDLGFPGGLLGLLDLTRTFNSLSTAAGTLGPGWTHVFGASVRPLAQQGLLHHAAASVTFNDLDGRVLTFTPNPAGGFTRAQDLDADLVRNTDNTFALTYNSGEAWAFDANGRATARSREGQNVTFDYDAGGLLLRAGHSSGPHLTLSYDGNGRLTQAEASDGRTVTYAYAADGTLTSVTDPAGGITRYTVTPDNKFQVTDPDGNVVVSNTPATGRVTHQDFPTGGHADFTYDTGTGTTTVTSQSGAVMTFQADTAGRMTKITDPNGDAATFAYDANGFLAEAVSPAETHLTQAHDVRGNLMTSTFGGATTNYSYDTANRPTSVTDPTAGTVHYTYGGTSQVPSQVTDQNGAPTHFESANGLVTKITDADGNVTTYAYDTAGNLLSITDPAGEVTRFTYDHAGHRTSQITPTGATTQWAYDTAGRVASVSDPTGAVTSYQYSAAGRVLAVTDPVGAVTRHEYDASGQLTSVTDPLGRVTRYAYDHDGNLVTTTAPNGAVTRTEYDHSGRVTAVTDPTDAVTRNEYDTDGNLTAVTDPLGNITRRAYDTRGNLIAVTDPTGAVTRYTYDANDRQIVMTDPLGGIWQTSHDSTGRALSSTDPSGAVTRQTWTPGGNVTTRTDPLGRETRYVYSPTGQVVSITDPQGGVTQNSYDPDGRRITSRTAAGLTTHYRWDAAARLAATVDSRGWITRYEYDPRGQQVAEISPSGAITRDRYDPAAQRTETIDPNGSTTRLGYDEAGHLTEVTDAKDGITRYGYDAAGRQTSFTDPLGRSTTRAYDAAGNLITITDPAGRAQHLSYDADRRLIRSRADDGSEVAITYDAAGRRTSMADATGTTHYGYDATGRLLTVTGPDGEVTAATYDAAGQQTSLTYPDGLELTYQYDLNGRLSALHDSRAGDAVYAVDPDGRLLTEQLPGRLARRYHYEHGLLRRFLALRDGHPIARTSFTHDPDGRIATQRDDDRLTRYRYDAAGQLTGIVHQEHTPRRDPGSPRPPHTDGGDRSTEAAELHLTYDVLGNRTSRRYRDIETRYHFDAASQLLASEAHDRHIAYRYDSSGRLIEEHDGERHRTIDYNGFGMPVTVTRTFPDWHERSQAVFNGEGLLTSLLLTAAEHRGEEQHAASVRYRWSADPIPQILSQRAEIHIDDAEHERPELLDADFTYGYGRTFASWEHGAAAFHTDALNSALRTDDTQAWVQAPRYDTFGSPENEERGDFPERPGHQESARREAEHARPPAPELPRFGYRGELAFGSMLYLRARTYDTALGRFTTPDPVSRRPNPRAAVSPYAYAANDPLNRIDPLGLWSLGSLVSGVVHAAQHAVHAVTSTVTRAADIVAGSVAHAYDTVRAGLAHVAAVARKDAGIVFHAVHDAAAHVVHIVRDAVSRSVGMVRSVATSAVQWVKKHNQIIGKIGSVLSNVSGALALAGLVIAPIPGLDALTPVLEGAAAITGLGALGAQGIAKAAGDQNITYGDLLGDALGAIPGGGDAEDAIEGITTADRLSKDAAEGGDSVWFGQARIDANFSTKSDVPSYLRGRPIADVAGDLRAGRLSPNDIPITAFEHEGQLVTVNNRGLAALSEGGLRPTNLSVVSKESVSRNVLRRLNETPTALGEGLPSPNIAITPSRSDWTVLRMISIPGG